MAADSMLAPGSEQENELCPSLSYKQRIMGFGCCLGLGFLLSILSWITVFQKEWVTFGIIATLANITALSSSMFLAGPKKQIKKMFEETRLIATIVYLLSMVFTFIAALVIKMAALVITACIIQYLAMIWYGLSYIPFARDAIKRIVGLK